MNIHPQASSRTRRFGGQEQLTLNRLIGKTTVRKVSDGVVHDIGTAIIIAKIGLAQSKSCCTEQPVDSCPVKRILILYSSRGGAEGSWLGASLVCPRVSSSIPLILLVANQFTARADISRMSTSKSGR
jgi:hypothetical protein